MELFAGIFDPNQLGEIEIGDETGPVQSASFYGQQGSSSAAVSRPNARSAPSGSNKPIDLCSDDEDKQQNSRSKASTSSRHILGENGNSTHGKITENQFKGKQRAATPDQTSSQAKVSHHRSPGYDDKHKNQRKLEKSQTIQPGLTRQNNGPSHLTQQSYPPMPPQTRRKNPLVSPYEIGHNNLNGANSRNESFDRAKPKPLQNRPQPRLNLNAMEKIGKKAQGEAPDGPDAMQRVENQNAMLNVKSTAAGAASWRIVTAGVKPSNEAYDRRTLVGSAEIARASVTVTAQDKHKRKTKPKAKGSIDQSKAVAQSEPFEIKDSDDEDEIEEFEDETVPQAEPAQVFDALAELSAEEESRPTRKAPSPDPIKKKPRMQQRGPQAMLKNALDDAQRDQKEAKARRIPSGSINVEPRKDQNKEMFDMLNPKQGKGTFGVPVNLLLLGHTPKDSQGDGHYDDGDLEFGTNALMYHHEKSGLSFAIPLATIEKFLLSTSPKNENLSESILWIQVADSEKYTGLRRKHFDASSKDTAKRTLRFYLRVTKIPKTGRSVIENYDLLKKFVNDRRPNFKWSIEWLGPPAIKSLESSSEQDALDDKEPEDLPQSKRAMTSREKGKAELMARAAVASTNHTGKSKSDSKGSAAASTSAIPIDSFFDKEEVSAKKERPRRSGRHIKDSDVEDDADIQPTAKRKLTTKRKSMNVDNEPGDSIILIYPFEGIGGISITWNDVARLDEDEFLNDTLIEFGMKLIMADFAESNPERRKETHVFNSFFYKKLTEKMPKTKAPTEAAYQSIQKWTNKVDLFEKRFIVVPINENLHWYLAIIANPKFYLMPHAPKKSGKTPALATRKSTRASTGGRPSASKAVAQEVDTPPRKAARKSLPTPKTVQDLSEDSSNADPEEAIEREKRHRQLLMDVDSDERQTSLGPEIAEARKGFENAFSQPKRPPLPDRSDSSDIEAVPQPSGLISAETNVLERCTVCTFDSLGGSHLPVTRALSFYLGQEALDKKGIKPESIPHSEAFNMEVKVPQQQNFCDCGLFLLHFTKMFLLDPDETMRQMQNWPRGKKLPWLNDELYNMREMLWQRIKELYPLWRERDRAKADREKAARGERRRQAGQQVDTNGASVVAEPPVKESALDPALSSKPDAALMSGPDAAALDGTTTSISDEPISLQIDEKMQQNGDEEVQALPTNEEMQGEGDDFDEGRSSADVMEGLVQSPFTPAQKPETEEQPKASTSANRMSLGAPTEAATHSTPTSVQSDLIQALRASVASNPDRGRPAVDPEREQHSTKKRKRSDHSDGNLNLKKISYERAPSVTLVDQYDETEHDLIEQRLTNASSGVKFGKEQPVKTLFEVSAPKQQRFAPSTTTSRYFQTSPKAKHTRFCSSSEDEGKEETIVDSEEERKAEPTPSSKNTKSSHTPIPSEVDEDGDKPLNVPKPLHHHLEKVSTPPPSRLPNPISPPPPSTHVIPKKRKAEGSSAKSGTPHVASRKKAKGPVDEDEQQAVERARTTAALAKREVFLVD